MRPNTFWRLVPGAALVLLTTGTSMALTLGRTQGAVQVGRPLDLAVPAGLDSAGAGELCASAEVLYGDTRVEPVRVEVRPSSAADTALVRVGVGQPVDEPFVTVTVQVGCTQRLTRRYVLLAEAPGDAAQAAAQPAPVIPAVDTSAPLAAPSQPVATEPASAGSVEPRPLPAASTAPLVRAMPPRTIAPNRAPRPVEQAAASPRAGRAAGPARPPSQRTASRAAAPAAPSGERPRLRLDAPEVRLAAPAAPPAARAASASASAPAAAPAAPAVPPAASASAVASAARAASSPAAAASGAAPAAATASGAGASPAGTDAAAVAAPADARVLSLEADLKTMRETVARNNAALNEMRARLEQAERERGRGEIVWVLGALLAAALALAAYFWSRARRASTDRWWAEREPRPAPEGHPVLRVDDAPAPPATPRAAAASGAAAAALADRAASEPASFAPEKTVALRAPVQRAEPAPAAATRADLADASLVAVEDLGDVQQQADFFLSLGEQERAIETLRAHIDAHPKTSALAWLALLDVYHRLGKTDEYEQVRRDFEFMFHAQLPAFADYREGGGGLDANPAQLEAITRAWGTRQALRVIDEAVLRQGTDGSQAVPSLETYRDLLMLRAVAADISPQDSGAADASSAAVPSAAAVAGGVAAAAASAATGEQSDLSAPRAQEASVDSTVDFELPDADAVAVAETPQDSALDINLDEFSAADSPAAPMLPDEVALPQAQAAAAAPAAAEPARPAPAPDGNLLEFDFDLNDEFKLPPKKS